MLRESHGGDAAVPCAVLLTNSAYIGQPGIDASRAGLSLTPPRLQWRSFSGSSPASVIESVVPLH